MKESYGEGLANHTSLESCGNWKKRGHILISDYSFYNKLFQVVILIDRWFNGDINHKSRCDNHIKG